MKKLLILGSGTAGTMIANAMRKKLSVKDWQITIIDKSLDHIYQPGLLFLPLKLYGYNDESAVKKQKQKFLPSGVDFVNAQILEVNHAKRNVKTSQGQFDFDLLVVAMGCDIHTEDTDGLAESLGKGVGTFYTLPGALALQKPLANLDKGTLLINIAELPFKCPVAPIEFAFLADYYYTLKGNRKNIDIVLSTPMTGAFTKPIASDILGKAMAQKNIRVVPNFNLASVDHVSKKITSFEKMEEKFDELVIVPPQRGADLLDDSGLGNGAGYLAVDDHTLKSKFSDHIYGVGDITDVHTSKAGSVAHFMAEVVIENLLLDIQGKDLVGGFDGHSNCFIESGYHKGFLVDFNYEVEPLPGKFPLPVIGPFSLLKDTYLNHYGKMIFRTLYWTRLLKGKQMAPFGIISNKLTMAGKDSSLLKKS